MIMYGTNITMPNDKLAKVQEEYFYNSIIHPKQKNEALLQQLRVVYTIDPKQYAKAKKTLPYIVCGIFKPEFRRRENFAYIDRFIIDIDKLSAKLLDLEELRKRLSNDQRIMMCFSSPSGDGLKLMFRMKEQCFDYGLYSVFYKEFLRRFAMEYGLEQVIDRSTSDVSRACFISMDPQATFNPQCEPVDMSLFVKPDDPLQFFDLKREIEQQEKVTTKTDNPKEKRPVDPEKEVMDKIKQQLGVKPRPSQKRPAYVPEELQAIMDDLKLFIEEKGLTVKSITSIQYGKQIHAFLGLRQAEINLFYGKRGFTVVIAPRSGTDDELNTLLADIVESFLNQ